MIDLLICFVADYFVSEYFGDMMIPIIQGFFVENAMKTNENHIFPAFFTGPIIMGIRKGRIP